MAAKQNLGVYSLEEAAAQCRMALSLLEHDAACADDAALADLLADFASILQLQFEILSLIGIVETWMGRVDRLGNEKHAAVMLHHYAMALLWACRYRDAQAAQRKLSSMAESLQDDEPIVCAFAVRVQVEMTLAPRPANKCTPDALDNFRNCPTDHLISQWSKRVTSTDDARAFMGSPVITRLSAKRLMPTPFNVARDDNERLSPPRLIVFESSCPAFRSTVRGELLRAQYLATMQPPPQC